MATFEQFTNKFQISKTLRFELKPVNETADWIKKHNIIGCEGEALIGKDAERAENYKYLKKLLDEMHRQFLDAALVIDQNSLEQKELEQIINAIAANVAGNTDVLMGKFPSIITNNSISVDSGIANLVERLFNKTFQDWAYQYREDMPLFWQEDIEEIKQKLTLTSDSQRKKSLEKAIKRIEAKIKKCELKVSDFKGLYRNTEALQLLEWLSRKGWIKVTQKEIGMSDDTQQLSITDIKSIIRRFDGFATYLSAFNENRENIYWSKVESKSFLSTSVFFRIFEQNLLFHFKNIEKWQKIKPLVEEKKTELLERGFNWDEKITLLEKKFNTNISDFFTSLNFSQTLNQTGIDKYNQILGGLAEEAGKEKTQGLNEIVNLARQQLGLKRYQLPNLQLLYKQILSKGDKPFIDEFKNDQDLLRELNAFVSEQINSESGAIRTVKEDLAVLFEYAKNQLDTIYIPKDKLTVVSSVMTGSWFAINHWREALFDQTDINKQNKRRFFSVTEIQCWLESSIEDENFFQKELARVDRLLAEKPLEHLTSEPIILSLSSVDNILLNTIEEKLKRLLVEVCMRAEQYTQICGELTYIDKRRDNQNDNGFKQIECIKLLLEACNNLNHFFSHFTVSRKEKLPENKVDFWYEKLQEYIDSFPIFELYNKTRNYLTKKPFSTEKVKVNFEKATLLDGWAKNKEPSSLSIILKKGTDFYLGIINPETTNIFDYHLNDTDSRKKTAQKELLRNAACSNSLDDYQKMSYEQIASVSKDIFTLCWDNQQQKAIRKTKGREVIWGEHITRTKESKSYIDCETDRIVYFEYLIKCATSYWRKFQLNLKQAHEYTKLSDLLRDIEIQGYQITFDGIKTQYIDEKVTNGELYLFQIYNKDFSKKKKATGKDNLHTSYWKLLFDQENLKDVVLKLNGQAEIFYRPASLKYSDEQRQKGHHAEQLKDKFNYPILKDRRYSVDKFLFHCPITLNFKASGNPYLNQQVQAFLKNNTNVNIIGIDRGEKHLLYVSIINQQGDILHQESLNTISNGFIPSGVPEERAINYHERLNEKENQRDKARKSWSTIENIKELKAGYLSHVVHRLAQLIIKFNAIVVLEDLNAGFKRGRFKIEKQVYQKFEKALIDKLNYLVFKDRASRLDAGHYLNAYQLTNKFEGFKKLGKQSGVLFYVRADYTSTTDPISGFIKNVYKRYSSVEDSINFWKSFNSITYLPQSKRFEFAYDLRKLKISSSQEASTKNETKLLENCWTVSSHVQRSQFKVDKSTGKGTHQLFIVTDKIIDALNRAELNFITNKDVKDLLIQSQSKALHETMMYCFNAILTMRVTDASKEKGTHENDFILSPVAPYFDSRTNYCFLPENGDANGAYNIARKGIMLLEYINEFEPSEKNISPDLLIRNNDWQNYVQRSDVVKNQTKKL